MEGRSLIYLWPLACLQLHFTSYPRCRGPIKPPSVSAFTGRRPSFPRRHHPSHIICDGWDTLNPRPLSLTASEPPPEAIWPNFIPSRQHRWPPIFVDNNYYYHGWLSQWRSRPDHGASSSRGMPLSRDTGTGFPSLDPVDDSRDVGPLPPRMLGRPATNSEPRSSDCVYRCLDRTRYGEGAAPRAPPPPRP